MGVPRTISMWMLKWIRVQSMRRRRPPGSYNHRSAIINHPSLHAPEYRALQQIVDEALAEGRQAIVVGPEGYLEIVPSAGKTVDGVDVMDAVDECEI